MMVPHLRIDVSQIITDMIIEEEEENFNVGHEKFDLIQKRMKIK